MKCEKSYKVTGKFGIETESGDITGPIIREGVPFQHITLSQLNETLLKFSGIIEQVPPLYYSFIITFLLMGRKNKFVCLFVCLLVCC
jgi:tRNA U55 pseudouridine synthase TruB